MSHNEANSTNGPNNVSSPGGASATPGASAFAEDEQGATVSNGVVSLRFDSSQGGRLLRWQWRTIPPRDALDPATRGNAPRAFALVDPTGGALVDHFLPLGTRPADVVAGTQREYGDFVAEPYERQVIDAGGEVRVALVRDGAITAGKRSADVRLIKSAAVRPGAADIAAHYRVINSSLRPLQILFAVEYSLFAPGVAEDPLSAASAYYLVDGERPSPDSSLGSVGVSPNATSASLVNPAAELGLQLGWDRECDLWRMPSPTAAPAVRLLSIWRLTLPPRDNWAVGLWLAPG